MKKKLISLLLALTLCLSCAPAGPADEGEPAPYLVDMERGDVTVGYVAGNGATPHPLFCNEWDLVSIGKLVYESVVEFDENMKPIPNLAVNWTHEGKKWTVTLRKNILFHNGFSFTARDVKASYDAFLAADYLNPYHGRTLYITSMKVVDDFTLEVTGKYDGYITLYALNFPVMQEFTMQDELPSGTGPYWFVGLSYNYSVRVEANPFWWKTQPKVHSVVCRRYASSADVLEAFSMGSVDTVLNRSAGAAMTSLLSDVGSQTYATLNYEYLLPNLDKGVMKDYSMREAVAYAVDMADVVSTGYHNTCQQCDVPVLASSWLYDTRSANYLYSPERAFRNLTDLGWADLNGDGILNKLNDVRLEELTVTIVTYNDGNSTIRESAAKLIASYLQRVGIKAEVVTLKNLTRLKERIKAGNYDLALISICMSEVPGFKYLVYTDGSANMNHYSSAEMDRLIDAYYNAPTEDEFKLAIGDAQVKLVKDLPIIGVGYRSGRVLASHSLSGLKALRCYSTLNGFEFLDLNR